MSKMGPIRAKRIDIFCKGGGRSFESKLSAEKTFTSEFWPRRGGVTCNFGYDGEG